jgi:biotin operon repressor
MTDHDYILAALTAATGPLTLPNLCDRSGLPARAAQKAIQEIRTQGLAPIASDGHGYRLERDPSRYAANIEARHSRAIRQMETCQGERQCLERMWGRAELDLWPVSA